MAYTPPLFTLDPTAYYTGTLAFTGLQHAGRLSVGDVVHITSYDFYDPGARADQHLSGITIAYNWWVNGAEQATHADALAVTTGMAGEHISLTISFAHLEYLRLPSGCLFASESVTSHGVLNFGAVNAAPTAVADVGVAFENGAAATGNSSIGGVLKNDHDLNGDALTVVGVDGHSCDVGQSVAGAYGHLTLDANGAWVFHVNDENAVVNALSVSQHLTDHFHYTVSDGYGGKATADFDIVIHGHNDPTDHPAVLVDNALSLNDYSVPYSKASYCGDMLSNDSDPDGDHLHVATVGGHSLDGTTAYASVSNLAFLQVTRDGHYSLQLDAGAVHALDSGQSMHFDFAVAVTASRSGMHLDDGGGIEHLVIDIAGHNEGPVGCAMYGTVTEDSPCNSYTSGLVDTHFHDPEGDAVQLAAVNGAAFLHSTAIHSAYGTLNIVRGTSHTYYTFSIDNNSTAVQALGACDSTRLTFDLTASDGKGATGMAPLYIEVHGVNDAPTLVDDSATLYDATTYVTAPLEGNVLCNDHDVDRNDQLRISWTPFGNIYSGSGTATTCSRFGALHLHSDGQYTFDVNATAVNAMTSNSCTNLHYSFTVSDGHGGYGVENLDIHIQGTNDAPRLLHEIVGYVTEDSVCNATTNGSVWTALSDPEHGDISLLSVNNIALTKSVTIDNSYGELHFTPDGSLKFTIDNSSTAVQALGAGDSQQITFDLKVADSLGATAILPVNVVIYGVNDPIDIHNNHDNVYDIAYSPSGATNPMGNVLCNDHDVDRHDQISINFTGTSSDSFHGGFGNIIDGGGNVLCPHEYVMHSQYGTLHLFSTGQYTFDVNQCAVNMLSASSTTCTNFTFHVTDHHGGGGFEHLTIQLHGANEAPTFTGSAPYGSVTEDTYLSTASNIFNYSFHDADHDSLHVVGLDCNPITTEAHQPLVETTAYGTLHVTYNGDFTFDLNNCSTLVQGLGTSESYQLTFKVTVSDLHGGSIHVPIDITIYGVNDPISISNDCVSVFDASNNPSGVCNPTGNVTFNDRDPDFNDVIKVDAWATAEGNVLPGSHTCTPSIPFTEHSSFGTLSLYRDGHYTFDVNQVAVNALGSCDTTTLHYAFHVTDSHGGGGVEQLNIVIHGTNDAPIASMSHFAGAVTEDSVYCDSGSLYCAFSDAENNTLTFHVPCAPSGTTSIASAYGVFHITASGDWKFDLDNSSTAVQSIAQGDFRTADFSFSVTDGHGGSTLSDVVITINGANDAPVGAHHTFTAAEQGFFNGGFNPGHDAAGNVLTGAKDDSGDLHTAVGLWDGSGYVNTLHNAYGTAHVTASGAFHFTVDQAASVVNAIKLGDVKDLTFTYELMDSHGAVGTGHVVVGIAGFDDGPWFNLPALTVTEDGKQGDSDTIIVNDPEGSGLLAGVNGHGFINGLVTVTGSYGQLHLTSEGDISFALNNSATIVQDLGKGSIAHDFFHVAAADGYGHTVSRTIDVVIHGANDAPVAGTDIANLFLISGPNVSGTALANDHDIDIGDSVHLTGFVSSTSLTGSYGHLDLDTNGHYLYHVNTGNAAVQALSGTHTLTDSFHYHEADGNGGTATGTINVVIHGGNNNHAPVANPDSNNATEAGSNATGALLGTGASGNVLNNDTDVDNGDTRFVTMVNGMGVDVGHATYGVYGWLTLNADGTYTYAVDDANSTVNALRPANNITDTFTYAIQDSHGATASSTVTITITGQNDEPTGTVTISGTAVAGNVLTAVNNFVDPEGVASAYGYQWQSNGVDIGGANTQTFQMTAAQNGTTIGVIVTYTDGGGTVEHISATLQAGGGQHIIGTKGADNLVGTPGDDTIDGGLGRDTMSGGAGNDTYFANDTHDVVIENANGGNDTIIASANYTLPTNVENLMLSGSALQAHGNDLDNVITGDEKANSIWGLGGADTLTGGAGADTFIYNSVSDTPVTGFDTIEDFNAKQKDKIDLRLIDANSFVPGNQAFKFIGTAAFSLTGNDSGLLRFDPVTHMLEGSTNADANPEFRILLIGVDHIGNDVGGISSANILL